MKLSKWAKKQGITYLTANRWFHTGKMPVAARQLPSGAIIVEDESSSTPLINKAVIYARVSSHDQKEDMTRQLDRLRSYAASNGIAIDHEYSEIASGLNSKRKKLNKILKDKTIKTIIVEHRDRLSRFGVEMVEAALAADDRKLIVINNTEFKNDMFQDFVDLVTCMCARIYGQRSAKNKAKKVMDAVKDGKDNQDK